jgi:hypothetical protein
MTEEKYAFQKRPILTVSFFVLIVILAFDFVLGLIFIPKDYNSFRTPHGYFHHTLEANRSVDAKWGDIVYPMHTNSLGFRDSSVRDVEMESEKRRILIMGDSHTEAVGVAFEDSFTGVLASRMESSNVEILNGAAVSYSPKLYYLKTKYLIEELGLKVDELFVFIDISDIQNEIAYQDFEPRSLNYKDHFSYRIQKFLERSSVTYYSIQSILKSQRRDAFYEKTRSYFKGRVDNQTELYASFFEEMDNEELLNNPDFHEVGYWLGSAEFMRLWGMEGLELGAENMRKLVRLCNRHDIEMTISVHPWVPQIVNRDLNSPYVQFWAAFAQENDIGFINMFPLFINEIDPNLVFERYFIHNDNHWNEAGHRYVGGALSNHID